VNALKTRCRLCGGVLFWEYKSSKISLVLDSDRYAVGTSDRGFILALGRRRVQALVWRLQLYLCGILAVCARSMTARENATGCWSWNRDPVCGGSKIRVSGGRCGANYWAISEALRQGPSMHEGYFTLYTIAAGLAVSSLTLKRLESYVWRFPLDYLINQVDAYLLNGLLVRHLLGNHWLSKLWNLSRALNLLDSRVYFARPTRSGS
jgi:hypothetical protein